MCSYLVEPIRYRKVVVEMMGSGNSGSSDAKPHINLNRDQELAISSAVETFEKRCDEVWKMRENLCEQVKQTRVCRGSELENMRSFIQVCCVLLLLCCCSDASRRSFPEALCCCCLGCNGETDIVWWFSLFKYMVPVQVHAHMETLQDSLRAENEVLVRFLGDVGRILGPAPLTNALFASGGQDIFTYCQAIHCRALMVNSSSLGSGAVTMTPNSSAPGASGSLPGLPGPSPSQSWLSGRDGTGSAAITGSIPLVENMMMPTLNDSTAMDLDQQMRDRSTNDHSRRLDTVPVPGADSSMHGGMRKPPSPAPQHQLITHESPFLYGPGERSQAGGDNGSQPVQAPMPSGFRAPKSEPGVNSGQPMGSGGEFIELFRSIGDGHGRGDSTRLSAGLRSLLKDVPGSMNLGLQPDGSPFPFPSVDNPPASSDALPATGPEGGGSAMLQPTELLANSLAANLQNNGSPAVKGFLSQLLTHQQGQQAQGQAGQASAAGSNTGAAPNAPGRAPNLTELETLLHSKEGSRTLEILAQDLTTTRTLSAGELMSIQPEELTQAAAQAATPSTPTQAPPEVSAPSSSQSPAAQVISGIAPVQRPHSAGVAQVTSGQCE